MTKIIELEQTCFACPSQWDGKLETGEDIYVRYRHGGFSFTVNPFTDNATGFNFRYVHPEGGDGMMTTDEMLDLIKKDGYTYDH